VRDTLNIPAEVKLTNLGKFNDNNIAETYFKWICEIAEQIPPEHRKKIYKMSPGCGSGATGQEGGEYEQGDPTPENPGVSKGEGEIIRREVAQRIKERALGRGDLPAGLQDWAIDLLAPPKIDWRKKAKTLARSSISRTWGYDQDTWGRLHNLTAASDYEVYLPSTFKPKPRFGVVHDTSGSMGSGKAGDAMHRVSSELNGMFTQMSAEIVYVSVDSQASTPQMVQSYEEAKKLMQGGGGTDMRVGIKAIAEMKDRPDTIFVFTDGDTPWPDTKPRGLNVIACIIGRPNAKVPAWLRRTTVHVPTNDI
jgi:predicted metal-dependent peptidase